MLDAAIVIGVLISAMNLGDWILRPAQKEAFQRRVEALTLWFEYTRPISWFGRLNQPQYAAVWSIFCGLFLGGIFFGWISPLAMGGALALLADLWIGSVRGQLELLRRVTPAVNPSLTFWLFIALVGASIGLAAITLSRYGARVTTYLANSGRFWPFFRRLVLVYATSAGAMALIMLGAREFGGEYWYAPIGLPLLILSLIPLVISTVGLLMFSLVLIFALLEGILKLLRAVSWRIVEYSKGAWAATILLFTAALGIYKVLQ